MEQQLEKSLDGPFSILAVILALMVLDLVLIIRDFYSNLRCFLQPLLQFLYTPRRAFFGFGRRGNLDVQVPQSQLLPSHESQVGRISDRKYVDEVKLSGVDAQLVMERLGIFCNPEGDGWPKEDIGATQIAELFTEREPSLCEVKEAFDVFDTNCDGFIDARELCSFLSSFGFLQISEDDCRSMIRAFDEDGDSVIDFREFTKLVEKSLH